MSTANSKQRNTYQENYKNVTKQKSVVFEPRPLPPFPPTPHPTHRSTPDSCSFLFPPEGFLPGRSSISTFLILTPTRCCWGWVPGKCGWEVAVLLFHSAPTYQTEALHWVQCVEKTGVLIILLSPWLMSWWFHFRLMPPSECSTPRAGVSLRKKLAIVPNPSSRALAQRFCPKGGADHKTASS